MTKASYIVSGGGVSFLCHSYDRLAFWTDALLEAGHVPVYQSVNVDVKDRV